jgi:DNA repair protein RecO
LEAHTGIIVKTTRYNDVASIVHLFSEELGIIAVYVSHSSAKKGGGEALITPLNEVEITLNRKNGSLWQSKDCRLSYGFLGLRNSLSTLQGSVSLLNAIVNSQPEERPAPVLYALLKDYLRRLERGEPAWKIVSSFQLKLLRFEGIWSDELPDEVPFSPEEWLTCVHLAYCRTHSELQAVTTEFPDELAQKIDRLFVCRIE